MMHKHISSVENPQFKRLKKLLSSARERRKEGQCVIEGAHLLQALADAGGVPSSVIVREEALERAEIAALLARFAAAPRLLLSRALFDAIAPVETSSGLMAIVPIPKAAPQNARCAVLLEAIQDPGNLGSILRTAAAAGCEAVYLSKGCVDAWAPKVLRAGMGAHFSTPIYEQQDLAAVARGFPEVYATRLGAPQSLYAMRFGACGAFVFGNEGAGLSAELLDCATTQLSIPMPGRVESLNVAAAVAICLFERLRQSQGRDDSVTLGRA